MWSDSLEIPNLRSLQNMPLEIFSKYILQEAQDPPTSSRNGHQDPERQFRPWAPHDFYRNVHVPADTAKNSADVKCDMIECQLYPFQRRAVRWLLQREGVEVESSGKVLPIQRPKTNLMPASFREFTDVDGKPYFASHLLMTAARGFGHWYDAEEQLKGGILAEEMGLGKTVEMIQQAAKQPPLERLGQPRDIAEVVAFLVSPAGHWVNGQVVYTNGGLT